MREKRAAKWGSVSEWGWRGNVRGGEWGKHVNKERIIKRRFLPEEKKKEGGEKGSGLLERKGSILQFLLS